MDSLHFHTHLPGLNDLRVRRMSVLIILLRVYISKPIIVNYDNFYNPQTVLTNKINYV